MTKPFGTSELLARIRTALRHTRTAATSISLATSGRFKAGGLEIDYDKRRVFVDGESVHLTQNEYRIVSMLGRTPCRVLTYDDTLRELWGLSTKENRQILRVNMANIRRKLEKNPAEPQYIFTENKASVIGCARRTEQISGAEDICREPVQFWMVRKQMKYVSCLS